MTSYTLSAVLVLAACSPCTRTSPPSHPSPSSADDLVVSAEQAESVPSSRPPTAPMDLDGDGRSDLVINAWQSGPRVGLTEPPSYAGAVLIRLSRSGETQTVRSEDEHHSELRVYASGDFNGDGLTDLDVPTAHDGSFRFGDRSGELVIRRWHPHENVGGSNAVGDVNGDGFDDLVIESRGETMDEPFLLYLGGPDGLQETASRRFLPPTNARRFGGRPQLLDFDGDGTDDLVLKFSRVHPFGPNGGRIDVWYLAIYPGRHDTDATEPSLPAASAHNEEHQDPANEPPSEASDDGTSGPVGELPAIVVREPFRRDYDPSYEVRHSENGDRLRVQSSFGFELGIWRHHSGTERLLTFSPVRNIEGPEAGEVRVDFVELRYEPAIEPGDDEHHTEDAAPFAHPERWVFRSVTPFHHMNVSIAPRSSDLDGDGYEDFVVQYTSSEGSFVAVHRGTADGLSALTENVGPDMFAPRSYVRLTGPRVHIDEEPGNVFLLDGKTVEGNYVFRTLQWRNDAWTLSPIQEIPVPDPHPRF